MSAKSLILGVALALAALPLLVGCSDVDDPTQPSARAQTSYIVVSPSKVDLKVGLSARLTAYMMTKDGETIAQDAVEWTSSEPGIVRVYNGRIFARRPGIAVVTAGCGTLCGWAEVTVSEWDEGEEDATNGVN